ncbi:hypothetical protein [Chitinimonas naiadis]
MKYLIVLFATLALLAPAQAARKSTGLSHPRSKSVRPHLSKPRIQHTLNAPRASKAPRSKPVHHGPPRNAKRLPVHPTPYRSAQRR